MPDIFVAEPEGKNEPAPKKQEPQVSANNKSAKNSPIIDDLKKAGNRVHLFTSFCHNPQGITFKTQEQGEIILLFLRKHFATNLKWIIIAIFALLIPLIIAPFIVFNQPLLLLSFKNLIFFALFYYLLVFAYIYLSFITWYFNIGLVTNLRIIDIDFMHLIYKHMTATKLSLVQEVSSIKSGVMSTFFNYGDIFIQTAGTNINVEFEAAPKSEEAVDIIQDLIGKNA